MGLFAPGCAVKGMESEFRQNEATGQWVIIAPGRGKRPHDFRQHRERGGRLPAWDAECPFCPGNERMLPPLITEVPAPGRARWQTRVAPNKFPALTPDKRGERSARGIYLTAPGVGRHEVIIESPDHNTDIPQLPLEEVGLIVETYHRRYLDLTNQDPDMSVIIFRNHGERAGTSLVHPHSQLVATGIVSPKMRLEESEAQRYFDQWGRCVYCDMVTFEEGDRRRVVLETDSFLAFIPFAAEVPFEVWVLPKRHQADFGQISDGEKSDLAPTLQEILARLSGKLGDPDYNYVINSHARYKAEEPALHWFLQIRPRLTTPAGFEIGTGIPINPSVPEEDADFFNQE